MVGVAQLCVFIRIVFGDISAQLCVFIRIVFGDISAKEELLTIVLLKGHTRGDDIFHDFMEFVNKSQLPL